MPRPLRVLPVGVTFHIYNRAIEGQQLFESPNDYQAFDRLIETAVTRRRVDLFNYVLMPNHWHFQCSARGPGELTRFVKWLSQTHAMRLRRFRGNSGRGAVYQSRFQAVAVQPGEHFLALAAYIDRNPVRKGLVAAAENWTWGGLARALRKDPLLARWPTPRPADWLELVGVALAEDRVAAIRDSINAGLPLGSTQWVERTAARLGLAGRLQHRSVQTRPPATPIDVRRT